MAHEGTSINEVEIRIPWVEHSTVNSPSSLHCTARAVFDLDSIKVGIRELRPGVHSVTTLLALFLFLGVRLLFLWCLVCTNMSATYATASYGGGGPVASDGVPAQLVPADAGPKRSGLAAYGWLNFWCS